MSKVRPHYRWSGGRRRRVRQHFRLTPRRAGALGRRGVRYARHGHYKAAAIVGAGAVAVFGGWAVARGTGALLVGLGIALAATGYGFKRLTDGGDR
jgi:hypothetical protein